MENGESSERGRSGLGRLLTSDIFLGSLVAILSILTALAAYQTAVIDAVANGYEVEAIKTLTESNTEYLRTNQQIILDYSLYDNYVVNVGVDDFAAEYYQNNFSLALVDSIERQDGPFDQAYYDEQYATSDNLYNDSLDLFDQARLEGDQADRFQLVMLIFAVALSLSAWASVAEASSRIRVAFAILASIILVGGLLTYMAI